jgi:hypothetical protein
MELLAYAKACFDHCTSPFETMHLIKKQVKADECVDLSREIANIIEDAMLNMFDAWVVGSKEIKVALARAEAEFLETQQELSQH